MQIFAEKVQIRKNFKRFSLKEIDFIVQRNLPPFLRNLREIVHSNAENHII
jgi:hypothetical protein